VSTVELGLAGLPVGRLSRRFVATTSAVAASLLVCLVVLLVTWPRSRAATASAPTTTLPARAPPMMPATSAEPSPPAPTATGTASPSAASPATTGESSPSPPVSGPRFSILAAHRAFLSTSHETARCKRSTMWGVAKASVTFANDGSVDHVVIGPPFTGTPTGACVADVLRTVHVPPFGGAPVTYITRFYVSPQ